MTSSEARPIPSPDVTDQKSDSLIELAGGGLLSMFDAGSQLFCHRLKLEKDGLVREGLSARYTIITLLGLSQAASAGRPFPVDVKEVLSGLLRDTNWIGNLGDLGLLLWLCALDRPEELAAIPSRLNLQRALDRFPESSTGRTMELAWFLSGLAHAALAEPAKRFKTVELAQKTYKLLRENQGDHGIFGHMALRKSFEGRLRGRIGSFADQVYPIYALTRFGQAYDVPAAFQMARKCADAICGAQGPLGQWWWQYDASTGETVRKYPVYAVHQDGMAPMALFALSEATQSDFREPIYKGLSWINGKNELGRDLRDSTSSLIWRCLYRTAGWRKYRDEVGDFLRPGRAGSVPGNLQVLMESRPYHPGWLLYAFAGRDQR